MGKKYLCCKLAKFSVVLVKKIRKKAIKKKILFDDIWKLTKQNNTI